MTFYFLAILTAVMGLATVLSKSILRAAIYLMAVLSLSAGLYLHAGFEFLAAVQILVYVGGIVVLLVFAVMLTRSEDLTEDKPSPLRKVLGFVGSTVFFLGSIALLKGSSVFDMANAPAPSRTDIKSLGRSLLDAGPDGYVLPFEVVSVLLLAVLIGGIVIARSEQRTANRQEGEE